MAVDGINMKMIISLFLLGITMTDPASAGFSIGMPDAVLKRAKKLDDRVKGKKQEAGWVLVPGNPSFGTNNFYVMKYEAKNWGGKAISREEGLPWTAINHPGAVAACAALGGGAHLVTLAEAQTISRNIEAQPQNWADGVIGSSVSAGGGLKRGNSGLEDSASYNGRDGDFGANRNPKAKLVLATGEELWDWAGNAWEWVYGEGLHGVLGTPSGVLFGASNTSWTFDNGIGTYSLGAADNPVMRGGGPITGEYGGVFAFASTPNTEDMTIGFRCAR